MTSSKTLVTESKRGGYIGGLEEKGGSGVKSNVDIHSLKHLV